MPASGCGPPMTKTMTDAGSVPIARARSTICSMKPTAGFTMATAPEMLGIFAGAASPILATMLSASIVKLAGSPALCDDRKVRRSTCVTSAEAFERRVVRDAHVAQPVAKLARELRRRSILALLEDRVAAQEQIERGSLRGRLLRSKRMARRRERGQQDRRRTGRDTRAISSFGRSPRFSMGAELAKEFVLPSGPLRLLKRFRELQRFRGVRGFSRSTVQGRNRKQVSLGTTSGTLRSGSPRSFNQSFFVVCRTPRNPPLPRNRCSTEP